MGNNLLKEKEDPPTQQPQTLSYDPNTLLSFNDELSLVTNNFNGNTEYMTKKLLVSQAMKTQYVTVLMTSDHHANRSSGLNASGEAILCYDR